MNHFDRFSFELAGCRPVWRLGLILALLSSMAMALYAGESERTAADPDELVLEDDGPESIELVIEDDGAAAGGGDELVIEDDGATAAGGDELVIEEAGATAVGGGELVIEEDGTVVGSGDELVIEEDGAAAGGGGELVIEEGEETLSIEEADSAGDQLTIEDGPTSPTVETGVGVEAAPEAASASDSMSLKVDEIWAEYGAIPDSDSLASGQFYFHSKATAYWMPTASWEFQLSGRVDGYEQFGGPSLDDVRLDYDESFARYRSDKLRFTLGAQKIIWGRLDEIPPTDRMSTHDLTRYILDDLADRRRANPAIRLERFLGQSKLDLVYLPYFREAELPDKESVWYPVNRHTGEVIGLKLTPESSAIIKAAPIDDGAPSTDGGFGARYSAQRDGLDYAITVQKNRQSSPYFAFNADRGVLEARYPRSWVVGGDFGFEGAGATWRFEAAWLSDTPVTRTSGAYDTTESLSWGGGVDIFPGDGDARLTLQLMGMNLIDAPAVIDREEIYLFNGSFEMPFAAHQWRAEARFYVGLDERDVYFNPVLTYTGWESQEAYIGGHYFDGADGTPGGYHEDDSLITLGWRMKF